MKDKRTETIYRFKKTIGRLLEQIKKLEAENKRLKAERGAIDEALNSGDGSYHP